MKWSWILGRQVQEGEGDAAGDVTESPNNGDNGLSGGRATTTSKDATETGIAVDEGNRDKTGSESEDKKIIKFDTSNLPTTDRVFRPIPGMSDSQIFKWEPANRSISVDKVIWRGRGTGDDDDAFTNIASSKFDDGEYPDDGPLTDVSRESAMLGFASFLDDKSPFAEYRTDEMVLRIEWSIKEDDIDSAGFSETGLFTVAGERDDVSGFEDMLQDIEDAVQDGVESIVTGIVGSNPSGAETLTRALPTNSAASTGTAIPTLDSDDGDSDSGGGSGGLSTGAIAGIAVAGAVVFLGLIGGLIFFFLRRRRRTRERGHYNNPDNSATFMAGDKEVHHQVTEAPHSTYSNDQQVPLSNLNGADDASRDADGPSGHHDHHHHHDEDDTEYVPYRDEDASPTSTGSGRARQDGAATPRGVSRSVAHLVEEGMTEDEIRRLEEEERQLDDAIQRRGQR